MDLDKEKLKTELIDLGFRVRSIGLLYWVDAFLYIKATPKTFRMMEIYNAIALKRNKTVAAIERAMRYSIEPAQKKIQQKYGYDGKIDNMVFINLKRLEE